MDDHRRRGEVTSELPADVIDLVLEHLSTRDAATTALLSTQWRDAWLRHGCLVFDHHFFRECGCKGDKIVSMSKIISHVLLHRVEPVKKFTLEISWYLYNECSYKSLQHDLDQWCLFLSRNGVEQLTICSSIFTFELPVCISTGSSIKQLKLQGFNFYCLLTVPCIFPNVKSLTLQDVKIMPRLNGVVATTPPSIPNLEKLAFSNLGLYETGWRWLMLHWERTTTLCLCGFNLHSFSDRLALPTMFPNGTNLQVIKLYRFCFNEVEQIIGIKRLLEKSPKLCELEIMGKIMRGYGKRNTTLRVLKDPNFINGDIKMLKTLKIGSFCGSGRQMSLVKALLSRSPKLEKVVIYMGKNIIGFGASKMKNKLLCLPRASQKVEFVFKQDMSDDGLVEDFSVLVNVLD